MVAQSENAFVFFVVFFFPPPLDGKNEEWYPVVIGPSAPWQLTVIQWGVHMLITRAILMMIDVVMHGQGRVTWRTTRFLLIKLFCQSFCISTCLDYDHLEHYGANAQNTYRRIHKSYCSRPIHTKRCYWADWVANAWKLWKIWMPWIPFMPCMPSMPMS